MVLQHLAHLAQCVVVVGWPTPPRHTYQAHLHQYSHTCLLLPLLVPTSPWLLDQ